VVVLVGLFFGVVEVLVPLRLDRLAASGALIGGTFLAAAAVQALAGPAVGRFSDRRGAWAAIRVSLLCAAILAVLLPLPNAAWLLIGLVVAAGPAVGSLWVPGMAVVSQAAAHSGLDQGYAFALVNLVWAAAQTAGTAGGALIADSGGDAVAYGALAVVFGAAFIVSMTVRGKAPSPAAAGGPARPSPSAAPVDPLRRTSTHAATCTARCERT
jgi:MFS family permease